VGSKLEEQTGLLRRISGRREDQLVWHYIKGAVSFGFLLITGPLFCLVMLWDVKGITRRFRHLPIKLRNTWYSYFDLDYVAKMEAQRKNECNHCGACCEILWRCPFLQDEGQTKPKSFFEMVLTPFTPTRTEKKPSRCSVHQTRPLPCRTFPIDPKTVEVIEKDRTPGKGCSYRFEETLRKLEAEAAKRKAGLPPQA